MGFVLLLGALVMWAFDEDAAAAEAAAAAHRRSDCGDAVALLPQQPLQTLPGAAAAPLAAAVDSPGDAAESPAEAEPLAGDAVPLDAA